MCMYMYVVLFVFWDINLDISGFDFSSKAFALRMTRASSRNVGKFYQTVKLSAENLHADGN